MQVDKDVLQAALARAITDSVTPEVQKEVFKQAIEQHLFRTRDGSKGVLSESFERALNEATANLAREIVSQPENTQKIREMLQQAFDDTMGSESFLAKIREKMMQWLRY